MKKGVNIGILPEGFSFEDGLKIIKNAGFESVELNLDGRVISLESGEDDIKKVKEKVERAGLEISSLLPGLLWKYPLTSSAPEIRKKGEEIIIKSLKICRWLGTDALLVVPGIVGTDWMETERVRYDIAYERSFQSIKKCLPVAEDTGVCICIENVWNKFLLSPVEMKNFVESFNSEFVRVYFDVGNVLIFGYPEDWIRILGKLIKRVHLKDFKKSVGNINGFCDLLEGDVEWPQVVKALKEVGYDGYLTAEMEPYKFYPEAKIYNTSLSMDKIIGR